MRPAEAILRRAQVLSLVATAAEGYPTDELVPEIEMLGIDSELTPQERVRWKPVLTLRAEADVRAGLVAVSMMNHNEETRFWRAAGLRWALDPELGWPP